MNTLSEIYYDKPVIYKKLKLYPILVKDYPEFIIYADCLTLEKNSIPDAKIISMSYLDFLYHITEDENQKIPYLLYFDRLLKLCLKEESSFDDIIESIKRYRYDEEGKAFFEIDGNFYNSKDFEEIKKIVCEQNLIEVPDETISKDVRDSFEKARRYKERLSGTKSGSFEDHIISLAIATGWSFEYIYDLSIRKFIKSIKRFDNLIHYKIYLTSSMSGMVEFKDKSFIKHWLSNLDSEEKYSDVSIELNAVQSKLNFESAKK